MSLLDFSGQGPKPSGQKKSLRTILGIGALVGVIALGTTLASSISLNSGAPVEFGQGVAQTTACDSNIVITPFSKFINGEPGEFKFSGITLSEVDTTSQESGNDEGCAGKSFLMKLYKENGDLIGTSYTISVADDGFFSSGDGELQTSDEDGASSSLERVSLTFTNPTVAATDVYTITIESSNQGDFTSALVMANVYLQDIISFNGFGNDSEGIDLVIADTEFRFLNNDGLMTQIRSNGDSKTLASEFGDRGVTLDTSDITEINGKAYGNAIATFDFQVDGKSARLRNVYHLVQGKSHIKITSTLSNTDSTSTLTGLGITIGTTDTMVESDNVYFSRGSISASGFALLNDISDRSNAVIATFEGINQILFSKSLVANSKWYYDCCAPVDLANQIPSQSPIQDGSFNDGSMALDFSVSNLGPGESFTFTWMLGGATDNELSRLAQTMFNAASADSYAP